MPGIIGDLLSAGIASMTELTSTLGAEDAYDLLEIVMINRHNDNKVRAANGDSY